MSARTCILFPARLYHHTIFARFMYQY